YRDAADALLLLVAGVKAERVGLPQVESHTRERRTVPRAPDLHGKVERRARPTVRDVGTDEARIEVERAFPGIRRDRATVRLRKRLRQQERRGAGGCGLQRASPAEIEPVIVPHEEWDRIPRPHRNLPST